MIDGYTVKKLDELFEKYYSFAKKKHLRKGVYVEKRSMFHKARLQRRRLIRITKRTMRIKPK